MVCLFAKCSVQRFMFSLVRETPYHTGISIRETERRQKQVLTSLWE
jgi:hypothetical protein